MATKTKDRCHSLVFGFILKIHFLFFFVVFGQMSSQIFQKRDDESPVGCAGALDTARPAYELNFRKKNRKLFRLADDGDASRLIF